MIPVHAKNPHDSLTTIDDCSDELDKLTPVFHFELCARTGGFGQGQTTLPEGVRAEGDRLHFLKSDASLNGLYFCEVANQEGVARASLFKYNTEGSFLSWLLKLVQHTSRKSKEKRDSDIAILNILSRGLGEDMQLNTHLL
ncbi:hypothetical protein NFI96_011254 [Prochilodus magdalenae]|nr:hypothetical protein NFI96_011254 [Prochilodus magdalenae]